MTDGPVQTGMKAALLHRRPYSINRRHLMAALGLGMFGGTAFAHNPPQKEREAVLLPHLPIIDPHHHLWDGWPGQGVQPYHAGQLLTDLDSGHRIIGTVFVECGSRYLTDGDPLLRPLGETQFVLSQSAAAPRIALAIVGYADLSAGERVDEILAAQIEAAKGRFRGVRQSSPYDDDPALKARDVAMRDRLDTPAFRAGFARLAQHGLSFDAWCFHPNLPQIARLAAAFPDTPIIVDHIGSPLGVGHYAADPKDVFDDWRAHMARLASYPNVMVKFGGLAMPMGGPMLIGDHPPYGSQGLARLWQRWFDTCLDLFGTKRMMFESNFPVDALHCDYRTLWNGFKRLAMPLSHDEQSDLFSRSAANFYRIDMP